MNPKTRAAVLKLLVLVLVIGISISIYLFRDRAEQLARFGYPGIFLFTFISYAGLLVPTPGIAVVFSMGGVINPIGVAVAAGAGAALGELTGYLAGYSSQIVTENIATYQRLVKWMQANGSLAILILSAIPNPLFDLAGATAGNLKMPYLKFLFWCFLGQVIKMLFFALLGKQLFNQFF